MREKWHYMIVNLKLKTFIVNSMQFCYELTDILCALFVNTSLLYGIWVISYA